MRVNGLFEGRGLGAIALATAAVWSAGSAFAQCEPDCQPGDIEQNDECGEIEPDPNGGCNFDPEQYQDIGILTKSGLNVCGTVGTWGESSRDLDWYRFELEEAAFLNVSLSHEVVATGEPAPNMTLFILEGDDCDTQVTLFAAASAACPFEVNGEADGIVLPAGNHVIIVTIDAFAPEEPGCPVNYRATLTPTFGQFDVCGDPDAGDCIDPNGKPGCNDFACCETVCSFNPLCCDLSWDEACVELAIEFCGIFIYECVDSPGAPANDCAINSDLLEIGQEVAASNIDATTDGPPTTCQYGDDIWYLVQAPGDGELSATMGDDTDFDCTIALYAVGTDPNFDPELLPENLIGCVDVNGVGGETVVLVDAVGGEYYLIQVGGFDPGTGPGQGTGTFSTGFEELVYNTGNTAAVNFDATGSGNFALTNLGFSAGCLNADLPQRRAAQAFTLPVPEGAAGAEYQLQAIHVYGFTPAGATNETLNYIIFSRNGQEVPTDADQIIAGSVEFPTPTDFPGGAANEDHRIDVDFSLPPGDYYLSVYGDNANCPLTQANFAWFTNAPDGINLIDPPGGEGPFMWRAATYPDPGFEVYQLNDQTLQQQDGLDPATVYSSGFRIKASLGEPECPSCPDFTLDGMVDGGDLGILLGFWNTDEACVDINGDGVVEGADLGLLLGAWGPCE